MHRSIARHAVGCSFATACAAALAVCAAMLPAGSVQAATGSAQAATGSPATSWRVDLAAPGQSAVNLNPAGGRLRVKNPHAHPAAAGIDRGYALDVLAAKALRQPVEQVSATMTTAVPAGAQVSVAVRGELASGR